MAVRGRRALIRTLKAITKNSPPEVGRAMTSQANALRGRAVALAPELTRKLILSSKVTKRSHRKRETRVVSFDTEYAVNRHEDFYNLGPISAQKAPTQDGVPGRKFLERPFTNMILEQAFEKEVGRAILRATRASIRRGRR